MITSQQPKVSPRALLQPSWFYKRSYFTTFITYIVIKTNTLETLFSMLVTALLVLNFQVKYVVGNTVKFRALYW